MQPYSGFEKQCIGGAWRSGAGQKPVQVLNPYTGGQLLEIAAATREDLDDAYRQLAAKQPAWAAMPYYERAAIMIKAADILKARREEFTTWLVQEAGSTRIKANVELDQVGQVLIASAGLAARAKGYIMPSAVPGQESRAYREPLGVVAMISPWNFPLMLSMRTVAPALALGNAVLIKPAEDTPVTGGLLLAKLFEEAGLPHGVINVVVGHVDEIGDAITESEVPGIVSFTGSTPVGQRIGTLAMSGKRIKSVALELGGNAPFVILKDADPNAAVNALVAGRFLHSGQICMSTNRAIIEAPIYDAVLEKLKTKVESLKVGDPNEEDTVIGPLISQKEADRVRGMVKAALKQGAKVLVGQEGHGGTLVPPHVLTGVQPEWAIATDEIFGPVLPVLKAEDEAHALALANATQYGLSSAVFCGDGERGVQFARKIQAGMTHVNGMTVDDQPTAPFGGVKNSGLGRFNDEWAIDEFTRMHWVTLQHEPQPLPF